MEHTCEQIKQATQVGNDQFLPAMKSLCNPKVQVLKKEV